VIHEIHSITKESNQALSTPWSPLPNAREHPAHSSEEGRLQEAITGQRLLGNVVYGAPGCVRQRPHQRIVRGSNRFLPVPGRLKKSQVTRTP
jgi:hypothetical protein